MNIAVLSSNNWVGIGILSLFWAHSQPCKVKNFSQIDVLLHYMRKNNIDTVIITLPAPWPGGRGIIEQLRRWGDNVRIVVVTNSCHLSLIGDFIRLQVHAIVYQRDATVECLLKALNVPLDYPYRSPSIPKVHITSRELVRPLSIIQQAVIESFLRGESPRQIARRAQISVKTVSSHKRAAMQRLGISNHAMLIAWRGR
jgi:two-component system capsular synthesis response regulator RcsB